MYNDRARSAQPTIERRAISPKAAREMKRLSELPRPWVVGTDSFHDLGEALQHARWQSRFKRGAVIEVRNTETGEVREVKA